jgi:recombination protein RecA
MLGGGIPRGRIVEVIGAQSSGKSLIAMIAIAHAQKSGEGCVYIDVEKAFDPIWAEVIGMNLTDLAVFRPNTGEDAFDILEKAVDPRAGIGMVVLDSIAQLIPTAEAEEDMGHQQMGLQARMVNKGLRKIVATNDNTAVIMINQTREKIGVTFGSPETLPGGKGQDFATSILLRTSRAGWLVEKEKRIGHTIRLKTEKNKLAPPWQQCEVPFYYKGLVDREDGLLTLGVELGIVNRSGPWYVYGELKAMGKEKMLDALREDTEALEKLKKTIEYGGEADDKVVE